MKKRLLCFLSAAMFLFAACARTEDMPDKPYFKIQGELPDIGEYSGRQEVKYHENASEDFVPDNYGTLIPFVASAKKYKVKDFEDDAGVVYASYGICTPDGKIVLKPIEGYMSYSEYYDGFPYFHITPHDEEMENLMFLSSSTIIAADGSWKLDLSAGSWVSGCGDGVLSVLAASKDDSYINDKLMLYDFDGNLLLEKEGIGYAGDFYCGYVNVTLGNNDNSACFIDIEGNIVSDIYSSCISFNQYGIACVTEYNSRSYLINTEFERISDIYEYIYFDSYTAEAIIARKEGASDIFSLDGEYITTIEEDSYLNITEKVNGNERFIYSYFDGDNGEVYKYSDGTDFVNENGDMPNTYPTVTGYFSHIDEDQKHTVFDKNGRVIATLENCNTINGITRDEKIIVYQQGSYDFEEFENGRPVYTNPMKTVIYDTEAKEKIAVLDGYGANYMTEGDQRYIMLSIYHDDHLMSTEGYYLFDTKKHEFVFSECLKIETYNINGSVYYSVCNDSLCTLYDKDLNRILRFINE